MARSEPLRPVPGGFATWLLTLIHHRAVDAARRESTIHRRMVAAPEVGENWSPTPAPGADQAAMARVAAGQVRAALHHLLRSSSELAPLVVMKFGPGCGGGLCCGGQLACLRWVVVLLVRSR